MGRSLEFCMHCSNPMPTTVRYSEGSLEATIAKNQEYFNRIFKLNYLKAFDTHHDDEFENLQFCPYCTRGLSNLHQAYSEFIQMGDVDCYLTQELSRLDEIIDCHQKKSINCDLITSQFLNVESTPQKEGESTKEDDDAEYHSRSSNYDDVLALTPEVKLETDEEEAETDEDDDCVMILPEIKIKSPRDILEVGDDDDDESIILEDPLASVNVIKATTSSKNLPSQANNKLPNKRKNVHQVKTFNLFNNDPEERVKAYMKLYTSNLGEVPLAIKRTTTACKDLPNKNLNKDVPQEDPLNKPKNVYKGKMSSHYHKDETVKAFIKFCEKNQTSEARYTYLTKKSKFANPCWYCSKSDFPSTNACVEHTKECHFPALDSSSLLSPSSVLICSRCSVICHGQTSLNSHLKWCMEIPSGVIIPKKFRCSECSKDFLTREAINHHMAMHRSQKKEEAFQCDLCDYKGRRLDTLQHHKMLEHKIQLEKVQCDECGGFFKSEYTLAQHKYTMHTPEGYEKYKKQQEAVLVKFRAKRLKKPSAFVTFCKDCNFDLVSRLAYINHRKSYHQDNSASEFVCDQCGRNFTRPHSLKDHIDKVHSDERPFICDKCGKSFKRLYNLKAHEEHTHTEEGRLRNNQKTREKNRRRKWRAAQIAKIAKPPAEASSNSNGS